MIDLFTQMCAAATEIQKAWEPKVGDWTDRGLLIAYEMRSEPFGQPTILWRITNTVIHGDIYFEKELTYLPSQSDLQGMLSDLYKKRFRNSLPTFKEIKGELNKFYDASFIHRRIAVNFAHWCTKYSPAFSKKRAIFSDMNQLWLAFVMNELYSKQWDNNKKEWK